MTDLTLPIEKLRNVGPRNISKLNRLGIKTIRDLLWHFPARYEDYSQVMPIANIEPGQKVNVKGEVVKVGVKRIFPRRMTIVDAIIQDESGAVKAVWFNQPFIANSLTEGVWVSIAGKVNSDKHGFYISSPSYEKISQNFGQRDKSLKHTQGLIPIYPETEGISSKYLRFLIKPILDNLKVPDHLPEKVLSRNRFMGLERALKIIHYPSNSEEAERAKKRLAFDDLLLFQIKALLERRKVNQLKSVSIKFNKDLVSDFIFSLPFELTTDQKVAAWEILKDLERSHPMNRLMEGDVGSGKTVVALIAAVQTVHSGYQAAFMAPTEVLANQHFRTISSLAKDLEIGLLTGSAAYNRDGKTTKQKLKKEIETGKVKILIGTHSLIQKDVKFSNLALLVIDEQHRFGVEQRAKILKDEANKNAPHLLSMTATPIPRTLALTIYGDLDISIIKEKPKNRKKIITKIITPKESEEAYEFIRSEVEKGRQVFVVCPRIEISKQETDKKPAKKFKSPRQMRMDAIWADVKAVEEEYRKLSDAIFPDLKIKMLHGKMKPSEKNQIMEDFKNGKADILVSTSVIEVGVDVPNATIMMIENAERFGLAQLHQFRGRIGRDEYQSTCFLFSGGDKNINERLKALVACDDGFILAEKDMAIRGPGEFLGSSQSGLPDLAMASLLDIDLIKRARFEARTILKEDPSLNSYQSLKNRLLGFQKMVHFE